MSCSQPAPGYIFNFELSQNLYKKTCMQSIVHFNVLETIENIHQKSEESQLSIEHFAEVKEDLKNLSAYLGVDDITAVIFASAFVQSQDMENFVRAFRHFGENEFMLFLKHQENVELLFRKKLLTKKVSRRSQPNTFQLPQFVMKKISKNETLFNIGEAEPQEKNLIDALEEFNSISEEFDNGKMETFELDDAIHTLLTNNTHIPLFQKIEEWKLTYFEIFFLLDCIWDAISNGNNNHNTGVSLTVEDYWKSKSTSFKYVKILTEGKSQLTVLNLIEIKKDPYRDRSTAKLSKNILKLLKDTENIELEYGEDANSKLILYKNIKAKPLFYNDEEVSQLEILKNALNETKYKSMQKRMAQKAMPTGITVLFYGEPGTGKTESVYQMAKESQRNIFKVDISSLKNMWFGESEKLVKKIFTDYAEMKKEEKRCPILLFNEADAVINKRNHNQFSTSNTENAIQNILLEELENFDGILFATTNLVENMDSAFERRFLFKIRFEKPKPEFAAKIWQNKLPFLSENHCKILAELFEFNGGEIENIARKSLMHEIVFGSKTDFSLVKDLCAKEKWTTKQSGKIGF